MNITVKDGDREDFICPFTHSEWPSCRILNKDIEPWKWCWEERPDWCPLNNGPVTVEMDKAIKSPESVPGAERIENKGL